MVTRYNYMPYVHKARGKIKDVNQGWGRSFQKTKIKLLEVKTVISKMKNTLNGINRKLANAEENISKLVYQVYLEKKKQRKKD